MKMKQQDVYSGALVACAMACWRRVQGRRQDEMGDLSTFLELPGCLYTLSTRDSQIDREPDEADSENWTCCRCCVDLRIHRQTHHATAGAVLAQPHQCKCKVQTMWALSMIIDVPPQKQDPVEETCTQ